MRHTPILRTAVLGVVGLALLVSIVGPESLSAIPQAAASEPSGVMNASLEVDANGDRVPDGWVQVGYGSNSARWTRTSDAHSGAYGHRVQITSYRSGDRKLVSDFSSLAPAAAAGQVYELSVYYKSTARTQIVAYYLNGAGTWVYWTSGAYAPATSRWGRAAMTTPPLPLGASRISFGLALAALGSVTTDDYAISRIPALPTPGPEPSPTATEPTSPTAPPPPTPSTLFAPHPSSTDGLVTNEFAYWNPSDSRSVTSRDWQMTSGSLFSSGGSYWSGVPDDRTPDATSSTGTNSGVFRLNTPRFDFGNTATSFDLKVRSLSTTSSTPAVDWDGIHVFLRYQSEYSLYYASVNRRDGHVVVKKKCPGGASNGGTYYALGEQSGHPIPLGDWQKVEASVRTNPDGSVTLNLSRAGKVVLTAIDSGVGCAPITNPGATGIRGDNADFLFGNFQVRAV